MNNEKLIGITAEIVSAHVSRNHVSSGDIGALVTGVHEALAALGASKVELPIAKRVPLVSLRASVTPDHIVCMLCASRHKMMKRHLRVAHDLTPDEYRREFGLPASYPMVTAVYSQRRRELAKAIGLGRKTAA